MTEGPQDPRRDVLFEAFTAGWQAALAVNITNPRVLAVLESCFDMWLEEAADEKKVFGLAFLGRPDLPTPTHERVIGQVAPQIPSPRRPEPEPAPEPEAPAAAFDGRRHRRSLFSRPAT